MAMFPALMNDTMFSDLFDDPFFEGWRNMDRAACDANMSTGMMSTDVRETDKGYMVDIDMPGFKKDDISLDLQNGYLTVSAHRNSSHEDKDGTLCLEMPKPEAQQQVEAKHQIAIEG